MTRARLRIRELAEAQGYNITTLAHASGLSRDTIRAYWREELERLDWRVMTRIARVLGIKHARDLIGNDNDN